VAYDIRDDRRLRSVATCVEGYAERVQYSVLICDLSQQEVILLRGDIEARIKHSEDSVMITDLGQAGDGSVRRMCGAVGPACTARCRRLVFAMHRTAADAAGEDEEPAGAILAHQRRCSSAWLPNWLPYAPDGPERSRTSPDESAGQPCLS